jgi:hypothetical protein
MRIDKGQLGHAEGGFWRFALIALIGQEFAGSATW